MPSPAECVCHRCDNCVPPPRRPQASHAAIARSTRPPPATFSNGPAAALLDWVGRVGRLPPTALDRSSSRSTCIRPGWIGSPCWCGVCLRHAGEWLGCSPSRGPSGASRLNRRTVARLSSRRLLHLTPASLRRNRTHRHLSGGSSMSALPATSRSCPPPRYRFEGKLALGAGHRVLGTGPHIGGVSQHQPGRVVLACFPCLCRHTFMLTAWMAASARSNGGHADPRATEPRCRGVAGARGYDRTWIGHPSCGLVAREPLLPTQIPSAACPGLSASVSSPPRSRLQAFYPRLPDPGPPRRR